MQMPANMFNSRDEDSERGLNDSEAIFQADSVHDAPTLLINGLGNTEPLFKVEYHPHSGIPTKIGSYSDCFPQTTIPPPDFEPWKPFKSRLDFEIAELGLEAALNKSQLDRLIKLFHRAFKKHSYQVLYKGVPRDFEISVRDPWDWAIENIVDDPMISPQIVWDAQKQYRWTGTAWERFFTEPWTGDEAWEAQSRIPNNPAAKLLPLIIYADKTKLSSFGTAKGYPIVARYAFIPHYIRNTDGRGGGRVVGWLPIVHEDTSETGKKGFVNFKNTVWHEGFRIFLERISKLSETGEWRSSKVDNILRWIWPIILMLSSDYEEMSVMSLIRGLRGKYPCPICLVPQEQMWDLSVEFPLRTQSSTEKFFIESISLPTAAAVEKAFKEQGLRPVKNAMWSIKYGDLHHALSYDVLHFDDNGLWEDHFFKVFKSLITSRTDIAYIDSCFHHMPRWRGLNHFDSVMNITFNDGTKNHDISKIFLFAAQDILSADPKSDGYLLLRCLRAYLNIRMYAGFHLHTVQTILAGKKELEEVFTPLMMEYIKQTYGTSNELNTITPEDIDEDVSGVTGDLEQMLKAKSWNFIKLHLRKHLFSDIIRKGASRNYSTKPNEKMHGPIKHSYLRRSNFKDYTKQILDADQYLLVSGLIRSNIDALDTYEESLLPDSEDTSVVLGSTQSDSFDPSIYDQFQMLGSPMPPITLSQNSESHKNDKAFDQFRIKLGKFLTRFLPIYGIPLPGGKSITEHCLLKVRYTCTSDWQLKTDYVRCNPKFHGQPRYDCVLVNAQDKPYIARLVQLFSCTVGGQVYPLALIQPFSSVFQNSNRQQKDIDLGLLRFRENKRKDTEFISIHTIIRGVVMVPDRIQAMPHGSVKGDFFLFDILDADMFLRARNNLQDSEA
ncbi:hypothetical protein C0992_009421 [Termitomyces sp. T32_za158]|nr:hypothetical protein C0992_009421 [Termitomyces sp. T32_za158]